MAPRPNSSIRKDLFRKRNRTLKKKAHEIATRCQAHVYVVVLFNGQFHVYNSHEYQGWPPSREQIEHSFPLPSKTTPADFETQDALEQARILDEEGDKEV